MTSSCGQSRSRWPLTALLLSLCACGSAWPDFPANHARVRDVDFFWDDEITFDPQLAADHLGSVLECFGHTMADARDLKVIYTVGLINCGGHTTDGCFTHGYGMRAGLIELSVPIHSCPALVPLAHEVWHFLGNYGEPDMEQEGVIATCAHFTNLTFVRLCDTRVWSR